MCDDVLKMDVEDGIATLTITRAKAYNAINLAVAEALLEAANHIETDEAIRAVILTGEGDKAFCAGGDVSSMSENTEHLPRFLMELTTPLHMAISRFAWMKAPVIAAINGVAAGAGLSMAAFPDLAIASEKASFTSAYTAIGMTPDGSSTYFLPRLIGQRRTLELYLTNRTLSAEEALDWGLVNQVVPHDQVLIEAKKLAQKLAAGPTLSYGGVKKLVQMSLNDSLESQMERESRQIALMGRSLDGQEGIRSFVEKRKPDFQGK